MRAINNNEQSIAMITIEEFKQNLATDFLNKPINDEETTFLHLLAHDNKH